jgi:hypothetical protein
MDCDYVWCILYGKSTADYSIIGICTDESKAKELSAEFIKRRLSLNSKNLIKDKNLTNEDLIRFFTELAGDKILIIKRMLLNVVDY